MRLHRLGRMLWALGLPPDMDASGLLPWVGVNEVIAALDLASGQLLSISAAGEVGTAWR